MRNGLDMAITHNIKKTRAPDRSAAWSRPHDPATNARPPGNGDLDQRATDKGRERLRAVLGR